MIIAKTTAIASGVKRYLAAPLMNTTGTNTMQMQRVDTKAGTARQVTSGFYNDGQPAFDPEGKYLYYSSDRTFEPIYSDVDNTWIYPNSTNIMAGALRADVPSPLATRDDEEPGRHYCICRCPKAPRARAVRTRRLFCTALASGCVRRVERR